MNGLQAVQRVSGVIRKAKGLVTRHGRADTEVTYVRHKPGINYPHVVVTVRSMGIAACDASGKRIKIAEITATCQRIVLTMTEVKASKEEILEKIHKALETHGQEGNDNLSITLRTERPQTALHLGWEGDTFSATLHPAEVELKIPCITEPRELATTPDDIVAVNVLPDKETT
jgi:hypothetical protein